MGIIHGPEICNLVGLYNLSKLKNVFSNCGFYRDDELGAIDLENHVVYENKINRAVFKII